MKRLSLKDKIIHDQFSKYGKNAKEWMNKCILMLPTIEKERIWKKKGFFNIYEYAAKIAGMSRNKVNEGLRILGKTEGLPAIRGLIEARGIFAVKPVVNIANKETDQFWAKKASEMGKSTLETFVRDYKKELAENTKNPMEAGRPGAGIPATNGLIEPLVSGGPESKVPESKVSISMKLSPEVIEALKKMKGEEDWDQIMKKLLQYSQRSLDAEQKLLEEKEEQLKKELETEKPESITTNTHAVTAKMRGYIIKRSGGKCEHPNCNRQGRHIHHINPFSLRKKHDPDNLVYLCKEHHKIVHLGYVDDSGGSWKQIEKLPTYDMRNIINMRISEFSYQNLIINNPIT